MQFQIDVNLNAAPALLEAINNLAAAFTADTTIARAARKPAAKAADPVKAAEPQPPVPAGKPVAAAESTQTATAEKAPAEATQTAASPSSLATDKGITVAEVRKAIAALAEKDRPRALSLLTSRGAQSVSALKPEHYADVYREATQ